MGRTIRRRGVWCQVIPTVIALIGVLGVGAATARPAAAQSIAVFGDNSTDDLINTMPGFTATLVTDAQIATPGFLNSFAALYMTRDGSSFGIGLSPAAAAGVAAYVGTVGNVALLNADFADGIFSDPFVVTLTENAVRFAAASGHGFVGEFNGAVSALTSNAEGFNPIGLIPGAAGSLGGGAGGSAGSLVLMPPGVGHPVTVGLSFPYNSGSVEFGATMTGVAVPLVLATFENGNPALIARGGVARSVRAPLLGTGGLVSLLLSVYGIGRRRLRASIPA